MNPTQEEAIRHFAEENELPVLALIPFDTKITEADMLGETPLKHKEISAVQAIDNICEVLLKKSI
jgi:CO dehydrogenase nickel-insertion accessory protein CooC1